MKEYLFGQKEEDLDETENLINIDEYKKQSLVPDKREKYDIYIPMVKDDDIDEDEEEED